MLENPRELFSVTVTSLRESLITENRKQQELYQREIAVNAERGFGLLDNLCRWICGGSVCIVAPRTTAL